MPAITINTVQSVPITSLPPLSNLLDHCEVATIQMFPVDADEVACILANYSLDSNRASY